MKRKFVIPNITLLSSGGLDDGGNPIIIGGGTGQGNIGGAVPVSYSAWKNTIWYEDIINDGVIDENDYAAWWESNNFTQEDWEELNPDLPWDDYF